MPIMVHHYSLRDGVEVCRYCGMVKNMERVGPQLCNGKPTEYDRLKAQYDELKTKSEAAIVQRWKDANGYDDLIAAYSATIDERNALREHLRCVVKYAIEDRATTRGVTRLARELDRILKAFPEMDPYAKREPSGGEP